MASPLDPFMHALFQGVLTVVLPMAVVGALIGVFKRDFESWIVNRLRALFHPRARIKPAETAEMDFDAPPVCPSCRKPMVKRMAKRGLKKDSRFWGCSTFPGCRGTRSISG